MRARPSRLTARFAAICLAVMALCAAAPTATAAAVPEAVPSAASKTCERPPGRARATPST